MRCAQPKGVLVIRGEVYVRVGSVWLNPNVGPSHRNLDVR